VEAPRPLRIELLAAALPPQLDGIGDYTARLAAQLALSTSVKILTAREFRHEPIPGVAVEAAFSLAQPHSVRHITRNVESDSPDWLLLQYNPFSYGRWGFNPYLPLALRDARRRGARPRIAVMVHEPFVPVTNWKYAIETMWQRWQLWMLGRSADVLFFSIQPWVQRFRGWFPDKPVWHLPVGSNIPLVPISRTAARARLGIQDHTVVLGLFGTAHGSRMLAWARAAAKAVEGAGREVLVMSIGPHSCLVREKLGDVPTLAEGPLTDDEVSRRFAAFDVYLAPFVDGVSTRRTTLMTALQHGSVIVGTHGPLTDLMLSEEHGRAFLLADVRAADEFNDYVLQSVEDASLRQRLTREACPLYQREFAWDRITSRLLASLGSNSPPTSALGLPLTR
jgi:glycosyltransferase involved in cell wall biosynthesis